MFLKRYLRGCLFWFCPKESGLTWKNNFFLHFLRVSFIFLRKKISKFSILTESYRRAIESCYLLSWPFSKSYRNLNGLVTDWCSFAVWRYDLSNFAETAFTKGCSKYQKNHKNAIFSIIQNRPDKVGPRYVFFVASGQNWDI